MQANFSANITTGDGVQMEVPLTTAPAQVGDDSVVVKRFQFAPWTMGTGKGLAFAFQLQFKHGAEPAEVAVDDVSDTPILNIFNDKAPILVKDTWNAVTPPHNPADEYAKWIMSLENSVKVYRFTVKLKDGTTHVLRYPVFAPANMKAFMRTQLGV